VGEYLGDFGLFGGVGDVELEEIMTNDKRLPKLQVLINILVLDDFVEG
jgi:hypothetical protein